MLNFRVTIYPKRVQIKETNKELKTYDSIAIVDGDTWRYQILRSRHLLKTDTSWRSRGYHNIHYHAHNAGTNVRFVHVNRHTRTKNKINEDQLSMW